jgi:Predicted transcriptional regulators
MATYREIAKIYKTLSDPNRIRILNLLQHKKLCVCEITEILNLATSTVSKHLSILQNIGFIEQEKEGKWVNYYINPHLSDEIKVAFISSLQSWVENEQRKKMSKKVKTVDREKICSR